MFGSFYRQPISPIETIEQLEVSMNNLKELNGLNSKHVILGGDFNLPDVNWTNGSIRSNPQYANEISEKMLGIMDEFNLKQVVQEPTRQNNILDLVFTTHPDLIEGTYVVPGMSDHSAVICDINFKTKPPINPPRSVYLYKHADMEGLQEQLRNSYLSFQASQPPTKSIEENWTHFKNILFDTIKEHIPQKTLNKKKSTPWFNSHIRRLIRQKQRRYNAARHSNSEQNWRKFRNLQKMVHNEMRKAHQTYIKNLLDIGDDDVISENTKPRITKRFWQYIKAKRKDTSGIPILKSEGKEITDAKQKADILNKQYISVFTDENPTLPSLGHSDIPDMPNVTIDIDGVTKLLRKATGPDLIPMCIPKEAASAMAPFLCFIFQQSIDNGSVPADWKHANIIAVYRKGSRTAANNYRPVSLTSVPCKLLEHIMF